MTAMPGLLTRVISAFALAAIGFSCLWIHPYSRKGFVIAVLIGAHFELSRAIDHKFPGSRFSWFGTIWQALFLAYVAIAPGGDPLASGAIPWIFSMGIVFLITALAFRFQTIEQLAPWLSMQIGAFLLLGPWGASMLGLFREGSSFYAIGPMLLLFFSVAFSDTGAYFTGLLIGKHNMSPELSPKKTWEGFGGGVLCTWLVGVFLGPLLTGITWKQGLVFGLFLSIAAPAGDLFFSAIKRYTGIKDYSQLIPGHGGLLDRFDSILFSAPIAFFYFNYLV